LGIIKLASAPCHLERKEATRLRVTSRSRKICCWLAPAIRLLSEGTPISTSCPSRSLDFARDDSAEKANSPIFCIPPLPKSRIDLRLEHDSLETLEHGRGRLVFEGARFYRHCTNQESPSNRNTAISQNGVPGNRSASHRSAPRVGGEFGQHNANGVPSNYHSNLLAMTTLPTIKRYELPSALILSG
jgi:hypothetical protein